MAQIENEFNADGVLEAFLEDPNLRELWFDGADREALRVLLEERARLEAAQPPQERPERAVPPDGRLAALRLSPDELKAWVILSPALQETAEEGRLVLLERVLADKGVTYGIRRRQLARLAMNPVYETPILAAEGQPPQDGDAGAVRFAVQPCGKPGPLPDGTYGVDVQQPDFSSFVQPGDLLCTCPKNPADRAGVTVRGIRLPASSRVLDRVEAGANVRVAPDGCAYHATAEGELFLHNGVLSVLPVLRLPAVDAASGDIRFQGSVYVAGPVETGRVLEATGNVAVAGVLEDCRVTAGGHLAVGMGIKGGGDCHLRVGGSLRAPFLENVYAEVGGDLYTDVLYTDEIRCEGGVYVHGRRGRIVGGSCVALEIEAQEVGNPSGSRTELEILSLRPMQERLETLEGEMTTWEKQGQDLERVIALTYNEVRREALARLREHLAQKLRESQEQVAELRARLKTLSEAYRLQIRVLGELYTNVQCKLEGYAFESGHALHSCRLSRFGDRVRVDGL